MVSYRATSPTLHSTCGAVADVTANVVRNGRCRRSSERGSVIVLWSANAVVEQKDPKSRQREEGAGIDKVYSKVPIQTAIAVIDWLPLMSGVMTHMRSISWEGGELG